MALLPRFWLVPEDAMNDSLTLGSDSFESVVSAVPNIVETLSANMLSRVGLLTALLGFEKLRQDLR